MIHVNTVHDLINNLVIISLYFHCSKNDPAHLLRKVLYLPSKNKQEICYFKRQTKFKILLCIRSNSCVYLLEEAYVNESNVDYSSCDTHW